MTDPDDAGAISGEGLTVAQWAMLLRIADERMDLNPNRSTLGALERRGLVAQRELTPRGKWLVHRVVHSVRLNPDTMRRSGELSIWPSS